jgi:(2Fe-2S) ferredoxin
MMRVVSMTVSACAGLCSSQPVLAKTKLKSAWLKNGRDVAR